MKFLIIFLALFALVIVSTAQGKDKSDCSLPKEIGPCRKSDFKFYYDKEAKACKDFIYGGCMGNNNNFDTQEECEKLCLQ